VLGSEGEEIGVGREGWLSREKRKGGQAADGEMESPSEIDGRVGVGTRGRVRIGWVRKKQVFWGETF
jgi:hypothetical protein